jgi:hypothetical protein
MKYKDKSENFSPCPCTLFQNSRSVSTLHSFRKLVSGSGKLATLALYLLIEASDLIVLLDAIRIAIYVGVPNGSSLPVEIIHFILQ